MSHSLTTELPRLAGWGTGYAAAFARAEEDYFSANERRGTFPRRVPREEAYEAANREARESEARSMVHALRLMDPAAFADLDRELPLKAFLRRQWRPPAPGEFVASLEEAIPMVRTLPPDQVQIAQHVSVLEAGRRPLEPIPIALDAVDEPTDNQRALFARLVQDEQAIEQRLIDEISLWYLDQAEYLAEVHFGRCVGETVYLPGDPCEDDFRRLTLIREIHLAPTTCRLAIVFQVPYVIDFEHGGLFTALVDEFEYISLGSVNELVWLV